MRLRRLDLTRYGRFTNHALDFGERGEGPDLHVVYGPNEAGKSTALSAFLDLLYGIEMRSPYNFLHPYDTMRIGAALEHGDAVSAWARVKANRNSLRDGHGQPVGDHALTAMLGGIDRDAYRSMFSLDDDTLERGGEDILKSQGDLGSLLFGASAGLSDLAERLQSLETEAERFHKGRARSTELADLKRALDEVDRERKAIDVQASTHARLTRDRDQAERAYDEAATALGEAKARAEEIARLRRGLELRAKLLGLRAELEGFADLPDPPPHWAEDIGVLRDNDTRLSTETDALDRRVVELEKALGGITVDEAVLALGERLDRLWENEEHRYQAAIPDLPRVRDERRDLDAEIAALLRRLGRPADSDPRALVLPASTVATLRDLITRRSAVEAELDAARRADTKAANRLAERQEEADGVAGGSDQAQSNPDPALWRTLAATVRALRDQGVDARVDLRRQARDRAVDAVSDALAALTPWSGDTEDLVGLPVPDAARLDAMGEELKEADDALKEDARAITELEVVRDRLVAEMDAVRETTGLVDDETARDRRAARDTAWRAHRAAMDPSTADHFEATMAMDDAATDSRISHATEVASLRKATVELARVKADLAGARERQGAAQARHDAACARLAAVLDALGLPPDWPLGSLRAWLGRRETALSIRADMRARDHELRDAEAEARRVRDDLAEAMTAVGVAVPPDASVASLLTAAGTAIESYDSRVTRLESAHKALADAEKDRAEVAESLKEAADTEATWRAAWDAALAECWLGADGGQPSSEAVGGMLDDLSHLDAKLSERATAQRRIDGMERDQAIYRDTLATLLAEIGETLDPDRLRETAANLRRRLAASRKADADRSRLRAELTKAREDRAALDAPLAALAARKAEMTALFGVETLTDAASALKRVERRDALREQARATERDLTQALRVPDAETGETRLTEVEPEALASEAAALDPRLSDLETRRLELFGALTTARNALAGVDGEDDVARLEARRRTLLLEIEDKAWRHLRLRLGIAAARRALSLYQERHRSSMLARAAEAFATISRGAYTGLSMQVEPDGEKLVALEAGGASKPVSALSKGTRFQLYLALRVAGYHEFAARHEAVPFVADDIMETFDDFRAEEAFRLFAGMAGVGQVVYLTHHRHLCDIARAVCPGVRIHTLDGPTPE
jgi:uncharacterized protein YhaN